MFLVTQSCPTLCDPMDPQTPLSMGILQARILEWVAMPSSRGFFDPRFKPTSPALAGRLFTTEPPGKPLGGILRAWNLDFLEEALQSWHTDHQGRGIQQRLELTIKEF